MSKRPPKPTDAEMAILEVLWERGPSTARDVQDRLARTRKTVYTTTQKFLQIMLEKGLVTRDDTLRAHIYKARYSEETVQNWMVEDLLTKVFRGSAMKLVARALSRKRTSSRELAEIRELLDSLEEEGKR